MVPFNRALIHIFNLIKLRAAFEANWETLPRRLAEHKLGPIFVEAVEAALVIFDSEHGKRQETKFHF